MKLFLVAVVIGLALVSLPVDDLVVGSAAAIVCEPTDFQCRARQLQCIIRSIILGGVCPA